MPPARLQVFYRSPTDQLCAAGAASSQVLLLLFQLLLLLFILRRKKIENLIGEYVHQKSVLHLLIKNKVENNKDFEWLCQMRFYYDPNRMSSSSSPSTWPTPGSTTASSTWGCSRSWSRHRSTTGAT